MYRQLLLAISWLVLGLVSHGTVAAERPNVVVLYSDDAGYADFGFQPGARSDMAKLTPNIDRIAHEGVRLSNAYMSGCVCSPSRAGLFTGIYQERFGYDNNLPPGTEDGLPLDVTFGTKRLQSLGYKTGLVGKWHLGYPEAFHPNQRGFDWFHGLLQGSRGYYPMTKPSPHRVIQENGKATPEKGYVTDRFGDAACSFIEKHRKEPFFLFVSFTAPHGPLQPKEGVAEKLTHIAAARRRNYAALVVSLDENVGKVLDCLERNDLEKSTLVVFTNDNGGQTSTGANNGPLRGRKGQLWEGGVRVPWAMRWPGKITAGSKIDDPVIALDLMPTIIELAGGKVDPGWKLDGVSIARRLMGQETSLPERPLFWRKGGRKGVRAVRHGKWKLVDLRTEAPSLYDLSNDVGETEDLASKHADKAKALLEQLDAWESKLMDPRWGPGGPRNSSATKPRPRRRRKDR